MTDRSSSEPSTKKTIPDGAPALRMAAALDRRREAEGGYAALARSIRDAYVAAFPSDDPGETLVDRRKLASIVSGTEEIVFSTRELRALDLYLEPFSEGLSFQPLFEKPNLIQTLARSGPVTFLLGSRPGDDSVNFPHWDVLAMAEIQRRLTAMQMPVRIDIQDVPMPSPDDRAKRDGEPEPGATAPETSTAWRAHFRSDRTLVCLGSNRTMPASGLMLEKMFGVDQRTVHADLPFRIVWSTGLYSQENPFRLDAEQIEARSSHDAKKTRDDQASALVLSDQILLDTLTMQKKGQGYGLCVAQRRKNGAVWILIAGVSGPATYATACLLHRLPISLTGPEKEEQSPVIWAVVSATVPDHNAGPIASLRDLSPKLVVGPKAWQPPRR